MVQPEQETYQFNLGHMQYRRIRVLGGVLFGFLITCSVLAITAGVLFWGTYSHEFTPYLKWQDALVALCWYIGGFVALGGAGLTWRFLHALHAGHKKGMVIFRDQSEIMVRDLSPENMKSIFWVMNSAFWCFVAILLGFSPAILIGWTLQISHPLVMGVTTGLAIVLSLAGLVVSLVAASFIVIGCVGMISFTSKLGSLLVYRLNSQTTVRIDNFVLTIIYPGSTESMVDLNLLEKEDQQQLLSLLHRRWIDAEHRWNPTLGEEIAQALEAAEARVIAR